MPAAPTVALTVRSATSILASIAGAPDSGTSITSYVLQRQKAATVGGLTEAGWANVTTLTPTVTSEVERDNPFNTKTPTKYVSNSRTQINGVTPFTTIQAAVNAAVPGDIIAVDAGTYKETVLVNKSGTATAPIYIQALNPNNKPIIDGEMIRPTGTMSNGAEGRLVAISGSHIVWDSIDIVNSRGVHMTVMPSTWNNGNFLQSYEINTWFQNIKILRTTMRKSNAKSFQCLNVDGLYIGKCSFIETCRGSDAVWNSTTTDPVNWPGAVGLSGKNVSLIESTVAQALGEGVILGNHVWMGDGVFVQCENALIRGCRIFDTWSGALYVNAINGGIVENNAIYQTNDTRFWKGRNSNGYPAESVAIASEAGRPPETQYGRVAPWSTGFIGNVNLTIRNNVIMGGHRCLGFPYEPNQVLDNIKIQNNLIYKPQTGAYARGAGAIRQENTSDNGTIIKNLTLENNIIYDAAGNVVPDELGYPPTPGGWRDNNIQNFVKRNNLWSHSPPTILQGKSDIVNSSIGITNLNYAPTGAWPSISTFDTNAIKLTSSSPAIGAGFLNGIETDFFRNTRNSASMDIGPHTINAVSGSSYENTGLTPDTTYYFRAKFIQSNAVESAFSTPVSATTESLIAPTRSAWRGSASVATTNEVGIQTLNVSKGTTQVGDIVGLAVLICNEKTPGSWATPEFPAGFSTPVTIEPGSDGYAKAFVAFKKAGSSEPDNYTIRYVETGGPFRITAIRFSRYGHHETNWLDQTPVTVFNSTKLNTINLPAITPVGTDGTTLISIAMTTDGTNGVWDANLSPPTGEEEYAEVTDNAHYTKILISSKSVTGNAIIPARTSSMSLSYLQARSFGFSILLREPGTSSPPPVIVEVPVADFSTDVMTGLTPLTVNFTNKSTKNPTSFEWDFDSSGNVDSTAQNPTYIYRTAGTYTAKLKAINSAGSSTKTVQIKVDASPTDTGGPAGGPASKLNPPWPRLSRYPIVRHNYENPNTIDYFANYNLITFSQWVGWESGRTKTLAECMKEIKEKAAIKGITPMHFVYTNQGELNAVDAPASDPPLWNKLNEENWWLRLNGRAGPIALTAFSSATARFTASISGTTLTVTSVEAGVIPLNVGLFGSGVAADTRIVSGPASGGVGTYTVNISQTVSSRIMTSSGTGAYYQTNYLPSCPVGTKPGTVGKTWVQYSGDYFYNYIKLGNPDNPRTKNDYIDGLFLDNMFARPRNRADFDLDGVTDESTAFRGRLTDQKELQISKLIREGNKNCANYFRSIWSDGYFVGNTADLNQNVFPNFDPNNENAVVNPSWDSAGLGDLQPMVNTLDGGMLEYALAEPFSFGEGSPAREYQLRDPQYGLGGFFECVNADKAHELYIRSPQLTTFSDHQGFYNFIFSDFSATSTPAIVAGNGSKTFPSIYGPLSKDSLETSTSGSVQKIFRTNRTVKIFSVENPSVVMDGTITAVDYTNRSVTVNVTNTVGTGSYKFWKIVLPDDAISWRKTRFGMGVCYVMGNSYVFQHPDSYNSNFYAWCDEYDNGGSGIGWMGYPLTTGYGPPRQKYQNVYRRDFDNAIVLLNPRNNGTRTVTLPFEVKRIQGRAGYSDTTVNTGQTIPAGTNITLQDRDAIILVKIGAAPPAPVANFTATSISGTAPLIVTFTDTSTGAVSRVWDLNSDNISDGTGATATYTYNQAGVYTAKLTVTGSGGATSTKTQTITVSSPPVIAPVANFTASSTVGTAPLTVTFTDISTGAVSRVWDFNGDNTPDGTGLVTETYVYSAAGTYVAKLTITGSSGATSTKTQTITVSSAPGPEDPVANFTASPITGNAPLTVTFNDTSTGAVSRVWDFNGDNVSDGTGLVTETYEYSQPGVYVAKLTVTGSGAKTSTKTQTITVSSGPGPSGPNNGNLLPTNAPATFDKQKNSGIFTFDGTEDYISTSKELNTGDFSRFSIGIWFKTDSPSGAKLIGFEKNQTGSSGSYDRHLYVGTDGKLYFGAYKNTETVVSSNYLIDDDTWYYATAVYDGVALKLYLNSDFIAETALDSIVNYTGYWRIGGGTIANWPKAGNNPYYKGSISTAHVYNKALTPQEIVRNYNARKNRFISSPLASVTAESKTTTSITLKAQTPTDTETGVSYPKFVIQRSTTANGPWVKLPTVVAPATTLTDSGLTPNTNYFYRIKAIRSDNKNSNWSGAVQIATNSTVTPTVPSDPTNLQGTVISSTQINLSWSDNANNEANYIIERAESTGDFSVIATIDPNSTTYNNLNLSASTQYRFRVKARNSVGDSGYTNTVTLTTLVAPPLQVPTAPTNLTATASSPTKINLSWTDNATNEANYVIERSIGTGSFSELITLGAGATTYENTGLTPQTTYNYRVKARNSAGDSTAVTASATTPQLTTPFTPIRINSGGDGYTDPTGNVWVADNSAKTGTLVYALPAENTKVISGTTFQPIYRSTRWDPLETPSVPMTYNFTVPNGDYVVRFHFADLYTGITKAGDRVFGIKINGANAVTDFDIFKEAQGIFSATTKDFNVSVTNSSINIEFFHVVENPSVNGIEVFQKNAVPPPPTNEIKVMFVGDSIWAGSSSDLATDTPDKFENKTPTNFTPTTEPFVSPRSYFLKEVRRIGYTVRNIGTRSNPMRRQADGSLIVDYVGQPNNTVDGKAVGVAHQAIPGGTLNNEILAELDAAKTAGLLPDAIILEGGTNDRGAGAEAVASRYEQAVIKAQQLFPKAKIIMAGIMPSPYQTTASWALPVRNKCSSLDNSTTDKTRFWVDPFTTSQLSLELPGSGDDYFYYSSLNSHSVHFTAKGAEKIALNTLVPAFVKAFPDSTITPPPPPPTGFNPPWPRLAGTPISNHKYGAPLLRQYWSKFHYTIFSHWETWKGDTGSSLSMAEVMQDMKARAPAGLGVVPLKFVYVCKNEFSPPSDATDAVSLPFIQKINAENWWIYNEATRSTSSHSVSTGSKIFRVNLPWGNLAINQNVRIFPIDINNVVLTGVVTNVVENKDANGTTTSIDLTVNVASVNGSGTYSNWRISGLVTTFPGRVAVNNTKYCPSDSEGKTWNKWSTDYDYRLNVAGITDKTPPNSFIDGFSCDNIFWAPRVVGDYSRDKVNDSPDDPAIQLKLREGHKEYYDYVRQIWPQAKFQLGNSDFSGIMGGTLYQENPTINPSLIDPLNQVLDGTLMEYALHEGYSKEWQTRDVTGDQKLQGIWTVINNYKFMEAATRSPKLNMFMDHQAFFNSLFSESSHTVATGSKTFTFYGPIRYRSPLNNNQFVFNVNQQVKIFAVDNPSVVMDGTITSIAVNAEGARTGVMTVNITAITGSGTSSAWRMCAHTDADSWQKTRFGIGCCYALGDGYLYQQPDNFNAALFNWADEYDNGGAAQGWMGYPLTSGFGLSRQKLSNGVYRRDFDNAVVLLNPRNNGTQTVTLPFPVKRIQGRVGYSDTSVNNGQTIPAGTSITLQNRDALVLVKVTSSLDAPELGTPTAVSFDTIDVPLTKEARGTAAISSYTLERSIGNQTSWGTIATGSATAIFGSPATKYRDTGRTGSTVHYYRLKARDANGLEATSAIVNVTTPAPPTNGPFTTLRINCGGPAYTDSAGNSWIADNYASGGTNVDDGSNALVIAGTNDPTIYRTNRWDPPEGSEMTYTIPIVNGTYRVRLHFSENWSGAFANDVRVFDVFINDSQYLFDFDIFAEAGSNKALIKSVNASISSGSELANIMTIAFRRIKQNPMISAIEITPGAGPTNPTPPAPTNFAGTSPSSTQINLSWTNNSNVHNRYILERAVGTTGTFSNLAKLVAGATSYSDTGLSGNTTYRYRLRARSSTGELSTTAETSVTTQQSPTNLPPNTPTGLTATVVSSSQINLSWNSVTNVTNYVIERSVSGGAFTDLITLANNVTTYNNVGLNASTAYSYRVRATNAAGSSQPSTAASATTLSSTIVTRTPRLVQFSASNVVLDKPWGGAFLPDGKLLVTERDSKKLIILRTDGTLEKEINMESEVMNASSVPADKRDTISAGGGQNGLMDIVLDPQFATNRYVFWTYSRPNGGGKETSVGRGVFDVNALTITNFTRIYTQNRPFEDNNHFGSRIAFHPTDQSLFITFSDRKRRNAYSDGESRLLTSPIGKIIRIDRNGNAINDGQNPFPNNLGGIIWSRGHRGAQGLAFRKNESGFVDPPQLWETEQGEDGGDEVNLIVKGGDYGWGGIDENGVRNGGVGYGREYNWRFTPPAFPGQYTMCIDEGWCAARDRQYRIPNVLIGGGNHTAIGAIEPKFIWPPTITGGNFAAAVTGPGQSAAPAGLMFYSGRVFGQWAGNMFVPTLLDWKQKRNPVTSADDRYGTIYRLTLTGNNVTAHEDMLSNTTLFSALINDRSHPAKRIRTVMEGPEGFIYIFVESSGGSSGKIWVLRT